MNINSANEDKKVSAFSFLNVSLDFTNQFKAEIMCHSTEEITKKEESLAYQKKSSNQNYNSFTNQLLQQKSFSYGLTPKKQPSEEIYQYLSDRDYNKNHSLNTAEKPNINSPKKEHSLPGIHIRPLETPKLEEQIKQKLLQTYSKVKINEQRNSEMRSEQIQIENKEDDKLPKRGLTYISRKLSQILRQKKRIKSSELFTISFFEEDEDNQIEEINSKTKNPTIGTINTGLKCENEPNQLKESKQRRNVRRRIYDSINVMVALGVIKKIKNQYIYIEQKDDLSEIESVIQQEDILLKKKDYLQKLKNDCLYKQRCLKYLTESYSKMKILRKLNTQYEEKININNENTRSSNQGNRMQCQQKIEFPFILMQNGDQNMKIQLRNDNEDCQKLRKVNDWTDYIEVSNTNKQSQIDIIRVRGQNLKIISDVDCINLLGSLEINQNAQFFTKNQTDILRDYDIINQHKLKKNEQSSKNLSKSLKTD